MEGSKRTVFNKTTQYWLQNMKHTNQIDQQTGKLKKKSKKQIVTVLLVFKKVTSFVEFERNSPTKASSKTKFLKNCFNDNEAKSCQKTSGKCVKKTTKFSKNGQELVRLPFQKKK